MDLGIAGRRAFVLGGNRGIGLGIARALAAEGVNIIIAARDAAKLAEAQAGLRADFPVEVKSLALDLSQTAELTERAARAAADFGPIDILVNNTGGPAYGGASGRPLDEWTGRFEDMVLSVIALTDTLLPGMRARKWGRVMTVVSSGVLQPIPILAISNSLRAAIVGWSKTLSAEVAADGVTVNILVPGRIETERVAMTDDAIAEKEGISPADVRKRSFATIPLGRYGKVEEFAAAAAFVASEQAAYMTGTMVRVDGGIVRSW